MDRALTLSSSPRHAVFIAGAVLLMLQKHLDRNDENSQEVRQLAVDVLGRITQMLESNPDCPQEAVNAVEAATEVAANLLDNLLLTHLDELETMAIENSVFVN